MNKRKYDQIHQWMRKEYGRPQMCESPHCLKKSVIYDWALKKGKRHAKKRDNYLRLCRQCHSKYDCTPQKKKRIWEISHTPEANRKRALNRLGIPRSEELKRKVSETKRSQNRNIEAFGERLSVTEWAEKTGIRLETIYRRIKYYGYTPEEALTVPIQNKKGMPKRKNKLKTNTQLI